MSADATDPDRIITRTEYIHDGCFVDEIDYIDLSDLEFNDNDTWLYIPLQCSIDSTIHDLYAWLKTEPNLDIQSIKSNKKFIDTRTFTRPKKRSTRMSFESIFEGLSSSVKSIWKPQSKDVMYTEDEEKNLPITIGDEESVPLMLKPSVKAAMNVLANERILVSGQESMEAFLNMSQSKGIDSFINLGEPEFSDLLMNVSQPSILYTSVTSSINEFKNLSLIRNETVPVTIMNTIKKSNDVEEILNSNSNINEMSVTQTADETITPNSSYCMNSLSNTFCKGPIQLSKGLNETYDTEAPGEASALQLNLDKKDTDAVTTLSSTFVTERNIDATFIQPFNKVNNDISPLDTTYLSSATYVEGPNLHASTKNNTYKSTVHVNEADLNVICNVTEEIEPVMFLETCADENMLDISFKVPICNQSTPMNPNMLNPISKLAMKRPDQSQQIVYSTLKAPTSLRRELLAEIQRSGKRKLDSTYNHIPSDHLDVKDTKENICIAYDENETDIPPSNRYNTYRKSTLTATMMANQCTSQNETITIQKELPDQCKFYTFTKKSNNYVEKADNTIINRNIEIPRPNMDGTFCKPLPPKAQKKTVPKILSKLPQCLQKSNPNLVSSSLKTGHASGLPVGCTSISSIGYIKGSQPNIVQNITEKSQLSSKLHPYGKLKSGSEQRLLEMNVNTNNQFPMKSLTAGSTESIESTQSAHSAPDLDDRLSTCSDSSSQNSCTRSTMNIEQLHQLVRMQEESLKHDSAPKPNIRVLENTWVEAKMDLPSPILKNGVEYSEIDRHSMLNTDLSMKCSSPIISPIGSSHALNNDGTSEDNVAKTKDKVAVIEKTEDPNQLVPKVENKTRLRQPTNWGTRSKPAAVISGIPRPASRIPALRFARPNAKATQGDLRKGYT